MTINNNCLLVSLKEAAEAHRGQDRNAITVSAQTEKKTLDRVRPIITLTSIVIWYIGMCSHWVGFEFVARGLNPTASNKSVT